MANVVPFSGGERDFEDQLAGAGGPVVLVFLAQWCPSSRRLCDFLPNIAHDFSDVLFLRVDIDKSKDLVVKYQIRSVPTLLFFVPGSTDPPPCVIGANLPNITKTLKEIKGIE